MPDPIKTLAEAINTNVLSAFAKVINTDTDQNNAMAGSLAFTESTLTIASGSVAATRSSHVIAAQSGTTDDLANITTGSISDGALLFIRPDSGDTITVKDAATGNGEIHLAGNADYIMSGDFSLILQRRGADWYEISRDQDTATWDFTSSQQTVTVDTALDVAHGLSGKPARWQVTLLCTTDNIGYVASTADEVLYPGQPTSLGSTDQGISVFADATNITIVQGVTIGLIDASTFNGAAITTSSWRWIVRASLI